MRYIYSIIGYIWSKTITILALISVWIFNLNPYNYISKQFNWNISESNPEPVKGAINLAILVFLYDIAGKILGNLFNRILENLGLKNSVEVSISVYDPHDPEENGKIKYTFGSTLKKIKIKVKIDYKRKLLKNIITLGKGHFVELHWNDQWLTVDIDDEKSKKVNGIKETGMWKCDLTALMTPDELDIIFEMPFYITVESNEFIRKGYITPKIKNGHKNKLGNRTWSVITSPIINREIKTLEIILNKGD